MAYAEPAPDFTKFIPSVLERVTCSRHRADVGEPCWHLFSDRHGKFIRLVCNKRILKAGFVGKIDPRSLRRKP